MNHLQGAKSKVKWLNSLPSKYLKQIVKDFKTKGVQLNPDGNYKVVVNVAQDFKASNATLADPQKIQSATEHATNKILL